MSSRCPEEANSMVGETLAKKFKTIRSKPENNHNICINSGRGNLKEYPIYQKGNPQLRVFLPNFWMKMVRPQHKQPPNIVQFITSMEMTDHDIKNYLEKIYKIPVAHVRSEIVEGELKRVPRKGYVVKDDDFRRAFVTLAGDEKFEFPDVTSKKIEQEESEFKKLQTQTEENYKKYQDRNKSHSSLPGWFSL